MVWEQLSINKPHLVYIILGGFTTLFMLCSSVIKERLYIGEATVATLCGIIFGPHAANLIDPGTWGNTDQITLEFSRIVLVVQCFAVGVELPRNYMEKHWRSVVLLLIPVMTFGWLVTSLFIWALLGSHLSWLDSLCCAACVTATDPVLASSVVGKGKFAKRIPKHLRDLLSAESGCNDGMAFPFIYLAIYLIRYRPDANTVSLHWFCNTILYECIWGATYGVLIGYCARRAIKYAHEKDLIDRESFLVFYFVLALFCAGSGSLLGMDDLLVGFACGVGFSNDGWFLEKTEETHVSNVIDLLINLAFFVYFGTIIPWAHYNSEVIGTSPWRLVVIALLVLFFRRIPIMLLLKPVILDVKTWREALFAGHFGPIGVGALFVAILARAELETETTTPLAVLPGPGFEHDNIIELIWPITTFLVITSIVVHGSSIAVFTLGKHINTLTLTMSYTQAKEDGGWMERLPRIQSRSKTSTSMKKRNDSEDSLEKDLPEYPPAAALGGLPRIFLRRQREEDNPSRSNSRGSLSTRRDWGPGGPISQSAISPQQRHRDSDPEKSGSETLVPQGDDPRAGSYEKQGHHHNSGVEEPEEEVYREGDHTIIEDEEGNVLSVKNRKGESEEERIEHERKDALELMDSEEVKHGVSQKHDPHPKETATEGAGKNEKSGQAGGRQGIGSMRQRIGDLTRRRTGDGRSEDTSESEAWRHRPARAFRFGRTIIVEDEDGEVIKKYDIPSPEKPEKSENNQVERKQSNLDLAKARQGLTRMSTWLGVGQAKKDGEAGPSRTRPQAQRNKSTFLDDDDDSRIRFTVNGDSHRMNKADFIKQIQALDPKARAAVVEDSDVPEMVKEDARADAKNQADNERKAKEPVATGKLAIPNGEGGDAFIQKLRSNEDRPSGPDELTLVDSRNQDIPFHAVADDLKNYSMGDGRETAAQKRRRLTAPKDTTREDNEDSDDDGTDRIPPLHRGRKPAQREMSLAPMETAAEKRRRVAALGVSKEESDSGEDENEARQAPSDAVKGVEVPGSPGAPRGIRFADEPSKKGGEPSVRWGKDTKS